MSTKLYAGLKLKDPSTDIFELIPRIAESIEVAFVEAAEELVAEELISWIDSPSRWPEEAQRTYPVFDAENAWRKQQRDYGSHHALNDPLRFSIVFGRSSAGNLLAYPYYSEDRYRKALKRLRVFDEYHYQNSSDKPRNISRKAWEQRYEEWDSLLSKDGTLGNLPLWEFGRSDQPFTEVLLRGRKKFDANSSTTADRRLKEILRAPLLQRVLEALDAPREQIFSMLFEVERTIARYLETPEGGAVARPAPVPKGTSFEYSELERYEIDTALLEDLLRFHLERIGS